MTYKELPAQAANIKRAVGTSTTCTPATVDSLKSYLMPYNPAPPQKKYAPTIPRRSRPKGPLARATPGIASDQKKRPNDMTMIISQDECSISELREKSILATEVVNATLRAMTEAIKNPRSKAIDLKRSSTKSTLESVLADTPEQEGFQPLQPKIINITSSLTEEAQRSRRSSSTIPPSISQGLRYQAECARIAFAALRSINIRKGLGIEIPYLQLETGMSALVGKMLALGFDDLAIKELQILKRRLDHALASLSTNNEPGSILPPKASVDETVSTKEEATASLLHFKTLNINGPLLALVITFQLQVLKLISLRSNHAMVEAAYKHIQLCAHYSPANLIERQINVDSSESRTKAARQLELLAQSLFSLVFRRPALLDGQLSGSLHQLSPHTVFKIQVLVLEIRSRSWKLSYHENDTLKDVIEPFSRYLSSFRRLSSLDPAKKYKIAKTAFQSLSACARFGTDVESLSAYSRENPLLAVYGLMADQAQDCCSYDEAGHWFQCSTEFLSSSGASPSRVCASLCRVAGLRMRAYIKGAGEEGLLSSMNDAIRCLEGDIRGEAADLDDLLLGIVTLRKLAFSAFHGYHKSFKESKAAGASENLDKFSKLIILGVKFLVRFLGKSPGLQIDDKATSRFDQRKKLVWNNVGPFFESIAVMTRFSMATGMDDWERIEGGLQDCLRLTSRLIDKEEETSWVSLEQGFRELNLVPLSNAYWYRYQYLKQTNGVSQEIQRCLLLSIDILKNQSTTEKLSGLLPLKLERLGCIYEASKDFAKAVDIYAEALHLQVDGGLLKLTAEVAAIKPLAEIFNGTDDYNVLGRLLLAYPRVSLRVDWQDPEPRLVFDNANLFPSERGILLEQQLTAIALILHVQSPSAIIHKICQTLASALLTIYTDFEFPIRRLRVCLQLLRMHSTHFSMVESDILDQVLYIKTSELASLNTSYDASLSCFGVHLQNARVVCVNLNNATFDLHAVKSSLNSWSKMLHGCSSWQSLKRQVSDVADWVLQLESLAEYLEMHGLDLIRVSVLHLLAIIREMENPTEPAAMVSAYSALGLQYVRLGYPNQAGHSLHKASKHLNEPEIPGQVYIKYKIACAEYLVGMGNLLEAEEHLSDAQNVFNEKIGVGSTRKPSLRERGKLTLMLAEANYALSLMTAAGGKFSDALLFARQNVRLSYRTWAFLEHHQGKLDAPCHTKTLENDGTTLINEISNLPIVDPQDSTFYCAMHATLQTAAFWSIVPRLFNGLVQLSLLFAHEGLFLEARYYVEQAQKIANAVPATSFRARCLGLLGNFITQSGKFEQGIELLRTAEKALHDLPKDRYLVSLYIFISENYALRSELESAATATSSAESIMEHLTKKSFIDELIYQSNPEQSLELKMDQLTLGEVSKIARLQIKPKNLSNPSTTKGPANTRLVGSIQDLHRNPDAVLLVQMKGKILQQRAYTAIRENKLDLAAALLSEATSLPVPQERKQLALLEAQLYLRQAQVSLAADPVFCVLPESTVSHPSTISIKSRQENTIPERCPMEKHQPSPRRKPLAKTLIKKPKEAQPPPPSKFVQLLNQSLESVVSVHSWARMLCSTATIHTMTDSLTKTLMMLSAASLSQPKIAASSTYAVYAMELGRTVSSNRGASAIRAEQQSSSSHELLVWPQGRTVEDCESSTINPLDFATFQTEYVDIIPLSWRVLSLSLSESHDEIRIARIRADQTPFILTLPLNRHSSRDPDEEYFGFKNGKDELEEIIALANYSAHDAQDMARKGANSEWWEVREALDTRLKELLSNMENIWLGGFRAIFSDCTQSPQLLSRFQQSLQNIFDKHLPSRQKPKKRAKSSRVALDSRVLGLFVGLGHPTDVNDLDEALMDLLYFVIDILQFHGEHNAYDEIDFDAIAIEVIDALRQYHEAYKSETCENQIKHTILILDKALHSFPWESLPCMENQAVSRLPSLGCLRDRLLQRKLSQSGEEGFPVREGLHVNRNNGASVLNPGGDLTATQSKFEQPLQALSGWKTITERGPTEDEMKTCLQSHEIFLYFGHGSGSQYIRSRSIKKLEKCAVTLLMGCSSGALTEAGEFEPYGTPINYMHAGCPALVANLWDVTDKDIDRFAFEVLEKWGLFDKPKVHVSNSSPVKRGGRGRGKNKVGIVESLDADSISLDQAVTQGRGACKLRYLNGAAPVIYGIPVFLS